MDDERPPPLATPAPDESPGRHARLAQPRSVMLEVLLAVVLPAGVIALIYLAPFIVHPALQPLGADTPGYIWRSGVVRALGLGALRPELFPAPIQPLGNRPAYPVVAGILQSISGIDPATFA